MYARIQTKLKDRQTDRSEADLGWRGYVIGEVAGGEERTSTNTIGWLAEQ